MCIYIYIYICVYIFFLYTRYYTVSFLQAYVGAGFSQHVSTTPLRSAELVWHGPARTSEVATLSGFSIEDRGRNVAIWSHLHSGWLGKVTSEDSWIVTIRHFDVFSPPVAGWKNDGPHLLPHISAHICTHTHVFIYIYIYIYVYDYI